MVRCTSTIAYEGSGWPIDSAPRIFAALRDGLYFSTGGALWRARGSVIGGAFSGEITPLASGGDANDFVALAEYNGESSLPRRNSRFVGHVRKETEEQPGNRDCLRPCRRQQVERGL